MAQSAEAYDLRVSDTISFEDILHGAFYGMRKLSNHNDLANFLNEAIILDSQWVNAFFYNRSSALATVRGDSGRFLPGDVSPFSPSLCQNIECFREGDDLIVIVQTSEKDFEKAHTLRLWYLDQGEYEQQSLSFFFQDSEGRYAVRLEKMAKRALFFVIAGPEQVSLEDFIVD